MSGPELASAARALWLGFRPVVVMVTACALIQVGCLVWIDNCVAVIPDDDPRTVVTVQLFKGFESGRVRASQIKAVDQDVDSFSAQALVHGNGDQDDNREESFFFKPRAAVTIRLECRSAVSSFNQRRTAVAYKDFGHLKIMSAGGDIANTLLKSFDHKEGCPCVLGGLSYCFSAVDFDWK